jgi:hypothetical protein
MYIFNINDVISLYKTDTPNVITVEYDDEEYIIDPSYEFTVKKNKEYFFSVLELKNRYPNLKVSKEIITDLIEYGKLSEMMNNGSFIVGEDGKEFFIKQAEYVKEQLKLRFKDCDLVEVY